VKNLWESYRETAVPMMPVFVSGPENGMENELDVYDQIAEDLRKYTRPSSQDEFEDYIGKEPCAIGKTTPLEWWCLDDQRKRWPRLSRMALDVLSIPAMSDEPERVFSGARRTVSWDRTQMSAQTLEHVECLKHWKRNGILNEWLNRE